LFEFVNVFVAVFDCLCAKVVVVARFDFVFSLGGEGHVVH
jgi:hypothetical protein